MPERRAAAKQRSQRQGPTPGAKKTGAPKTATKKTAAKKTATKKTATTKPVASKKKATTKQASSKKTAAKKTTTKKTAARKSASGRKKAAGKKADSAKRSGARSDGRGSTSTPTELIVREKFQRYLPTDARLHVLDVPFEEKDLAASAGARWDRELGAWTHLARSGRPLPERLHRYRAQPHSWEAWRQDDVNDENQSAGTSSPSTRVSTITLHPHQSEAAGVIAESYRNGRPGFLLADEVGLGKTYTALAALEEIPESKNVLILCPLAVVYHWRRSIDAIGGHHRYCVINYDRAKKLLEAPESAKTAKKARTRNQRTATKGRSSVAWDVIIADESHLLKNPTAQRTAAVRQLQSATTQGAFTIWCSATAGQNPVELSYLNRLITALTGRKVGHSLDDYAAWCRHLDIKVGKSFGGLKWDPNAEDLEKIKTILFDDKNPGAIRRRPTDIAGWPELERIAWPVGLHPTDREIYQAAWAEVRAVALKDRETRRNGRRPTRAEEAGSNPLVALLRFRQKASALRVDSTVELTETLLDNDKQVAVSVEFHDTLEALRARFHARGIETATIHGSMPAAEREENRVRFQRGEVPVILFTVKEGISLHAGERSSNASTTGRITVIHDPRWDAISTAQIEGRTWRDGQHSSCYHTYAGDTVEEKVVRTMLEKLDSMKTMLTDDTGDVLKLLDTLLDA